MSKNTHGGRRPGAGRPTIDGVKRVQRNIVLPKTLADRIKHVAKQTKLSHSEVVAQMIARGFDQLDRETGNVPG